MGMIGIKPEVKSVYLEQLMWWVYNVQRADIVIDRGVGLYDAELLADGIVTSKATADGTYLIATTGGRVDGGGKAKGDLHPDAELVHRYILKMGKDAHQVLVRYGRTGIEPDMQGEVMPVLVAKRDRRNRIVIQRDIHNRPLACVLELYPDPGFISMKRRAYQEWWGMMTALADALIASGRLESHRLLGVAAKSL